MIPPFIRGPDIFLHLFLVARLLAWTVPVCHHVSKNSFYCTQILKHDTVWNNWEIRQINQFIPANQHLVGPRSTGQQEAQNLMSGRMSVSTSVPISCTLSPLRCLKRSDLLQGPPNIRCRGLTMGVVRPVESCEFKRLCFLSHDIRFHQSKRPGVWPAL